MGQFRKSVIVFLLSAVGFGAFVEYTGVREAMGISWGQTLAMIPGEILLLSGFVVGCAILFDV